ncbi:MAG: hypothetical protein OHK0039_29390 [Bacteroidia bacterium]
MSIRRKILLYFSLSIALLLGGAFVVIFVFFSAYREEEFQQRQKLKISNTLMLLGEIQRNDEELIAEVDRLTIHGLLDEKMLIFDQNRRLVYASIDDTPLPYARQLIDQLSQARPWIETKDQRYDVVAVYVEHAGKVFYGVSKAYDAFGYTKLRFLGLVLVVAFVAILLLTILIAYVLARKITYPVVDLTRKIREYDFDQPYVPIAGIGGDEEIALLVYRFNELMKRVNDVFAFQKHAIHHISHELKTPVAILVSNFDRIEQASDLEQMRAAIALQKIDTQRLGDIIHSLLEIAKVESGTVQTREQMRIDEMIFDLVVELAALAPDFAFAIDYATDIEEDGCLVVQVGERLMRSALTNLMLNCIQYSSEGQAAIHISCPGGRLQLAFTNAGPVLTAQEQQYLFQHFFRGENSKGRRGFGLGLVFVHRVLTLYGGTITYDTPAPDQNRFILTLPLS